MKAPTKFAQPMKYALYRGVRPPELPDYFYIFSNTVCVYTLITLIPVKILVIARKIPIHVAFLYLGLTNTSIIPMVSISASLPLSYYLSSPSTESSCFYLYVNSLLLISS